MASTAASSIPEWTSTENAIDPRWTAVKRVIDSRCFARATLLREFLLYIATHELDGHAEEITEQKIGHRVYKRSEVYSPSEDNIVRVSAHQLRVKLHEFYETEGRNEPWIIEIPKGKYVPVFRRQLEQVQAETVSRFRETDQATHLGFGGRCLSCLRNAGLVACIQGKSSGRGTGRVSQPD